MTSASPSETGLYYFPDLVQQGEIVNAVSSDEVNHLFRVMRKKPGDEIFITDGKGRLIHGIISRLASDSLTITALETRMMPDRLARFTILLPILKNPDRFEFSLEKCVELGFTRFVAVKYQHSVKSRINLERLCLKAVAAMKQSLRVHLPVITYSDSLVSALGGVKTPIYFDQSANSAFIESFKDAGSNYGLVIGPEGGLSADEKEILEKGECFRLSDGRLRAETAVITAASLLANKIDFQ